jgi:sirohydrochlorin cobaltochelatase
MGQAILLFAHGSRDPNWAAPFHHLKQILQAKLPGHRIELSFLERMHPTFDEAADMLAASRVRLVSVVPLFLAPGGHVRADIPALISAARARHPGLDFRLLPSLGDSPDVIEAIAAWIARMQVSE